MPIGDSFKIISIASVIESTIDFVLSVDRFPRSYPQLHWIANFLPAYQPLDSSTIAKFAIDILLRLFELVCADTRITAFVISAYINYCNRDHEMGFEEFMKSLLPSYDDICHKAIVIMIERMTFLDQDEQVAPQILEKARKIKDDARFSKEMSAIIISLVEKTLHVWCLLRSSGPAIRKIGEITGLRHG